MTKHPGLGVMIHALGGGSREHPDKYKGREVASASIDDNALFLGFTDGVKIKIFDDGQLCCERRYMKTDDDVSSLVGGKILEFYLKPGPVGGGDWGEHEIMFLEIATDKGFVTISNHNEHNGYYGGFGMNIDEISD